MSTSREAGLYAVILVSLISVICAIIRLASLIVWIRSADISWNYILITFFSDMEACVALVTSSVPAILPLFRGSGPRRSEAAALPAPKEPEKEFDSQDSTAIPSTAGESSRRSRTFSRLSWLGWHRPSTAKSREKKPRGINDPRSTVKSETGLFQSGPWTELKDLDEDEEMVTGLRDEENGKKLTIK